MLLGHERAPMIAQHRSEPVRQRDGARGAGLGGVDDATPLTAANADDTGCLVDVVPAQRGGFAHPHRCQRERREQRVPLRCARLDGSEERVKLLSREESSVFIELHALA